MHNHGDHHGSGTDEEGDRLFHADRRLFAGADVEENLSRDQEGSEQVAVIMPVPQVKNTKDFLAKMSALVQDAAVSRGQTAPRTVRIDEQGKVRQFRITPKPFGARASVEEF